MIIIPFWQDGDFVSSWNGSRDSNSSHHGWKCPPWNWSVFFINGNQDNDLGFFVPNVEQSHLSISTYCYWVTVWYYIIVSIINAHLLQHMKYNCSFVLPGLDWCFWCFFCLTKKLHVMFQEFRHILHFWSFQIFCDQDIPHNVGFMWENIFWRVFSSKNEKAHF